MDEQMKLVVEALLALAKAVPEVDRASVSLTTRSMPAVYFHTRSEEGAAGLCTRFGISETQIINGSIYGDAEHAGAYVTVSGPSTGPKPLDATKLSKAFDKADHALKPADLPVSQTGGTQ